MKRLVCAVLALSFAAHSRPASACAPAPPPGVRVEIAEESAIIVWDEKAKQEHFVRRASFVTAGKEFGFLVPTPSKPDLAAVDDQVFDAIEQVIKPAVVYERVYGVEPTALCALPFLLTLGRSKSAPATAVAPPVRVLGEQRVAGYDAVILEADDPKALSEWLNQHGYASRPELTAWLSPYVAARWKLTAFKIARGGTSAEGQGLHTSAVRMSFAAERPFYPYREPADQRENLPASALGSRLLRVFFVGPSHVEGAISPPAGAAAKAPWPGRAVWSNALSDARLLAPLHVEVPKGSWLTAFEDRASPRPGTDDVFFSPIASKVITPAPVKIPTNVAIPLPLDVMLGGGALFIVLWSRRRKRQQSLDRS